ncbi:cellulose binding domain-containing protein [Sphaerisporangium album]|uniref:cellulose binding domain-containing protein n=1 Tax=Sphaerisporangium album TaxID=509200 RepID=UPI001FE985E8|nr:cellulose binding domain-containing protein [Sphaerisporangium album]
MSEAIGRAGPGTAARYGLALAAALTTVAALTGCSETVRATPPAATATSQQPSPPGVPSTHPVTPSSTPAPASCSASVKTVFAWPGGFRGEVTIRNTGDAPINAWYVQWTMPLGMTITEAWQGTPMQSGPTAMIHAPEANPRLAAGATATAGFIAKVQDKTPPSFTQVGCG